MQQTTYENRHKMVENKYTNPKIVHFFPIASVLLFVLASLFFFYLNPEAFEQLNKLNILQYNLQGVNYAFIMSLFAYILPGSLMTVYYAYNFINHKKLSPEIFFLLFASVLLILLGSISTSPEFKARTLYMLIASLMFPILNAIAFLIIAIKLRTFHKKTFLLNLTLSLYILYVMPFKLLFLSDGEITANIPIVICFFWYTSNNATFIALLRSK